MNNSLRMTFLGPTHSGTWLRHHELFILFGVFTLSSSAARCEWNGAGCCRCRCCSCEDRFSASLLPRGVKRVVCSGRSCQCHRGGEAAEVSERRGESWARLHPLPAIAVRRLLLWSHTGKTYPFSGRFSQARREGHCFCEGECVFCEYSNCGSVFLVAAGADWMLSVSPCGYKRAVR